MMEFVKHNKYGIGEIINRVDKPGGAALTVRYASGEVTNLMIPESFESGVFEVEGALKAEIEEAIAEKKRRAAEKRAAFLAGGEKTETKTVVKTHHSRAKKTVKAITPGTVEHGYEQYLIKAGYKQETDSGDPSTVYSYINAIQHHVLDNEGISWDTLKRKIDTFVAEYGEGGSKSHIGAKSNDTVINALRRFKEYSEL